MKTATLGGEWTMGPLDGGMVLIGKKFSQYLNSQGDPLLTHLSKGGPFGKAIIASPLISNILLL